MPIEIPEVVIERLPVYVRALNALLSQDQEVVSSQELGTRLGVTPAQIRKDLSYFGRFGKRGRGYNVRRLGRAILSYGGFEPQGFRIVEAFDSDAKTVGRRVGPLVIKDVSVLAETLHERPVDIAIVAVPAGAAQAVIDTLVKGGVRSILNYAPTAARVPSGVHIRHIDPVLALQSMTYYIKNARPTVAAK
jgi:redox-sensing transcriptional repressor